MNIPDKSVGKTEAQPSSGSPSLVVDTRLADSQAFVSGPIQPGSHQSRVPVLSTTTDLESTAGNQATATAFDQRNAAAAAATPFATAGLQSTPSTAMELTSSAAEKEVTSTAPAPALTFSDSISSVESPTAEATKNGSPPGRVPPPLRLADDSMGDPMLGQMMPVNAYAGTQVRVDHYSNSNVVYN